MGDFTDKFGLEAYDRPFADNIPVSSHEWPLTAKFLQIN